MENSHSTTYSQMKRKVYLFTLPILIATNIIYWLISSNVTYFMEVTVPPTCLLLAIIWLFVYKNKFIYFWELFSITLGSFYHLYRIHTMTIELTQNTLNIYMLWSPIYYILVFLIFERKWAFIISNSMFLAVILTSLPYINELRSQDIIIQFYFSTFIYIIVLFYFKKLIKAYISSEILIKTAYYDHLTTIGNRRSIDNWFEKKLKNAIENDEPFSVIYFDIDHFKQVNDTYGHEAGDQILKELSITVENILSPTDQFGRWGGEEFLILSNLDNLDDAISLAESIRLEIEGYSFQHVQHLTISLGVTSYLANDSVKTMMQRADKALYYAKNTGRNKVASIETISTNLSQEATN